MRAAPLCGTPIITPRRCLAIDGMADAPYRPSCAFRPSCSPSWPSPRLARCAPTSPARRPRPNRRRSSTAPVPDGARSAPADFAHVNGYPDTWTWEGDLLKSTGVPIGVMRTRDQFLNFELVVEWRHMKSAGNSGVFAWVPMKALDGLKPDELPRWGIEVQMLDHGYREWFRKQSRRQDGRLVHHQRRHLRGRQLEARAVRAALAGRLAQLPAQGAEPWRGRVESLLRARHQRRDSPLGQRRGGLRRSRRRPAHRLPLPRGGGVARRVPEHPGA